MSKAFTGAQLASAIGISVVAVWKRLKNIQPTTKLLVRGNMASAWTLEQLPGDMREVLRQRAATSGCRNEEHSISMPPQRWVPMLHGEPVKISELHPNCLEYAGKLQRALLPLIPKIEATLKFSKIEKDGVSLYQREFGHAISGRHWRGLVMRTFARDNGLQEWDRVEIYLPDRLYRNHTPGSIRNAGLGGEFPKLNSAFSGITMPNPTRDEVNLIWLAACDEIRDQREAGKAEKDIMRNILGLLGQYWFLAKSKESLRKTLANRWKAYSESGGNPFSIRDKRTTRKQSVSLPAADREYLVARSLDCGGRVAQAWREALNDGSLSASLTERYIANPSSKSHVPHLIRREIVPDVRRLLPLHHGPRRHELEGPHITRDYSATFAGQIGQMDDVTCPVYYWEEDPSSPTGYWFGRGQLILAVDVRSMLALGFALHSSNVYNMRLVRGLMLRWHDSWGLPKLLYLERGMWKKAKILKGEAMKGDEIEPAHMELGLREFGIEFAHAKLPRGKVIENIIGAIQNRMERLPGYAGRDEIKAGFERLKEQIDDVYAGRVHPSKYFFHKSQWSSELAAILENYNKEPQEGDILRGKSPLEVWNSNQSPEGLVHLGDHARYLLANHRIKMKVQPTGIRLRASLAGGTYCNQITGRFAKQEMLVWVNPDELDQIILTSLDKKQGPFVIPRLDPIPAIGAGNDQIAAAKSQIAEHLGYAKTLYRTVSSQCACCREAHCFNWRSEFTGAALVHSVKIAETWRGGCLGKGIGRKVS